MREYKFRVWDKIDNKMRYENDVDGPKEWPSILAVGFHGLPICIDKDSVKEHEIIGWNRDHNLTLMQWTGLNDSKGTPIYEGDVGEGEHATYLIYWNAEKGQYQAKIIKTRSVLSKHCSFPLWQYVEDDRKLRIEIIGNVHQHPELINS